MTSGQKIAFSLLVAMGLFAGFVMGLRTKLFSELETRYYTQTKIQEYTGQLNKISESCDSYITSILNQVEQGENAWTKAPAVRSYYVQNPSESDVNQRRVLTEEVFHKNPALNGIRIVDKNGRNVHYSSFDDTDILKQTGITKVYKNYSDIQKDADELSFDILEKKFSEDKSSLLLDEKNNRIIITVPYYWLEDVYAGQCLFYFRWSDVEKELTAKDVIPVGQKLTMFSDENFSGGFVYGLPAENKNQFKEAFGKYWKSGAVQNPEKLLQMEDGRFWVALTNSDSSVTKISGVYTSDIFELSREVIILIYICIFISILLIVFLLLSFNRDPEMVLKKRIKKIQYGIIKEYIDSEDKLDWNRMSRQLRSRKKDLSSEILKSLKVHSKKKRKELDEFLEQNWNDIFAAFEEKSEASGTTAGAVVSGSGELTGASLAEIRKIVEEVLQNTKLNVTAVQTVEKVVQKKAAPVVSAEEIEELDDVEEIEEVEEVLDDVEEIEEVEEVLDDVEEIEEVEEVLDDAEEIEEVEEVLDDAEEIEEAEEVLDDAEEEIEEVEEVLDDAEEIEEVEEVLDDAEEVEEAEDVLDDAGEIEVTEEFIDDAEEIEEAEDVLDDIEELEGEEEYHKKKTDSLADFNLTALLMSHPNYVYKPSNDTYFESGDFATLDNVMAEQMCIGDHIRVNGKYYSGAKKFTVYDLNKYIQAEEVSEDLEELAEDIPEKLSYYSMTGFAENLSMDAPILEAANIDEDAIIETEGVYSIASDIELNDVKQDKDFKALVDSVL